MLYGIIIISKNHACKAVSYYYPYRKPPPGVFGLIKRHIKKDILEKVYKLVRKEGNKAEQEMVGILLQSKRRMH